MQRETSRVTRPREAARRSYNRISRWYDMLSNRFEGQPRDMGLQQLAAREGETVLEIGFGTGRAVIALARAVGLKGAVYGIDISDGMLEIARSRVRKSGFSEIALLERGDAVQLPFREGFFDAAFMSFTLELFDAPEIPLVLGECRRVLRDGGRICVVAMSKKGARNAIERLYVWLHNRFPALIDCRPIYAAEDLEMAGLKVEREAVADMLGLPVAIVLATKSGTVPAETAAAVLELQPVA